MEFGRSKILAVALAAATGGPYLVSQTTDKAEKPKAGERQPAAHAAAETDMAVGGDHPSRVTRVITHADLPLEGLPVRGLEEIVRFDINPSWIMSRWGRVFTSPAEDEMRGYRVAMVSGTADYDVAGSMTYFFNRDQKLQRITFVGHTGNTQPLVALFERKYTLTRQRAEDPGLQIYQLKHSGVAISELRIEPATVIESGNPHGRYRVSFWLERPADPHTMFSKDAGAYSDRLWTQP